MEGKEELPLPSIQNTLARKFIRYIFGCLNIGSRSERLHCLMLHALALVTFDTKVSHKCPEIFHPNKLVGIIISALVSPVAIEYSEVRLPFLIHPVQ